MVGPFAKIAAHASADAPVPRHAAYSSYNAWPTLAPTIADVSDCTYIHATESAAAVSEACKSPVAPKTASKTPENTWFASRKLYVKK